MSMYVLALLFIKISFSSLVVLYQYFLEGQTMQSNPGVFNKQAADTYR